MKLVIEYAGEGMVNLYAEHSVSGVPLRTRPLLTPLTEEIRSGLDNGLRRRLLTLFQEHPIWLAPMNGSNN